MAYEIHGITFEGLCRVSAQSEFWPPALALSFGASLGNIAPQAP